MEEFFNIQALKNLYPNTINKFKKYLKDNKITKRKINYLDLLRFFDDNQLYIGISADVDGVYWYVDISEMQIDCVKSRNEAEILAITECFQILEIEQYG